MQLFLEIEYIDLGKCAIWFGINVLYNWWRHEYNQNVNLVLINQLLKKSQNSIFLNFFKDISHGFSMNVNNI